MTDIAKNQKQALVQDYLAGLQRCLVSLSLDQIVSVLCILEDAYLHKRHIFVIGNGGSAAIASHMACDLSKTILGRKRHDGAKGFRVIALGDNGPGLTAWANDVGYERVFAEPLRNWVDKGDVVIAITGSGNSPNVVEAVKTAKAQGAKTIALLGFDGGLVKQLVDAYILVESDRYGHIEDVHLALNHLITAYFEVFISD